MDLLLTYLNFPVLLGAVKEDKGNITIIGLLNRGFGSIRAHTNGGVQQRTLLRRVLRRVLETAFEKVLRRVLRRCLAVGFNGKKGSEKGS